MQASRHGWQHTITRRGTRGDTLWAAILAAGLLLTGSATAQFNIYWTGNGGDNLWSNPTNWNTLTLPEETGYNRVWLGHPTHTPDEPQHVILDMDATVARIYLAGTSDREVTVSAINDATLTSGDSDGFNMHSSATAKATLNLPLSTLAQLRIANYSDAILTLGPDVVLSGATPRLRYGPIRLQGTSNTRGTVYVMFGATVVADLNGGNLSTSNTELYGTASTPSYNSYLYLASDAVTPGNFLMPNGGTAFIGATETSQDVRKVVGTLRGGVDDALQIVPNLDGSSGNLIVQVDSWFSTSASIATIAGSTVQIRSLVTEVANPGVSGAGNLLVKADSAETEVSIRRHMTYTGRTMIERGEMSFTATNPGSLSPETILEIGGEGALRFLAHQQTVAGLRDYQGTAGAVRLAHATASLTVDAIEDSSFGGEIHGHGAVRGTFVKTGPGAFTLTSGGSIYDLATVTVDEGTFGLAGGRVQAGAFTLTGAVFAVTLYAGDEDATLVQVSGAADLTGATLQLARAPGYNPTYGMEYTLLSADTIAGASAIDMFGYEDGDTVYAGGMPFLIHYIEGNDSIRLTAIPEPGSLSLLVLAAAGLWGCRRRAARERCGTRPSSHPSPSPIFALSCGQNPPSPSLRRGKRSPACGWINLPLREPAICARSLTRRATLSRSRRGSVSPVGGFYKRLRGKTRWVHQARFRQKRATGRRAACRPFGEARAAPGNGIEPK